MNETSETEFQTDIKYNEIKLQICIGTYKWCVGVAARTTDTQPNINTSVCFINKYLCWCGVPTRDPCRLNQRSNLLNFFIQYLFIFKHLMPRRSDRLPEIRLYNKYCYDGIGYYYVTS